jgi:hypothetical protein
MTCSVRARLLINQMRRGWPHARSCRHDPAVVVGPYRPSGRNASPSGITPPTIMSPTPSSQGSWTEIRLSVRARPYPILDRANAPPRTRSPSSDVDHGRHGCVKVPAQIRSVASPQLKIVRQESASTPIEGTMGMLTIGVDPHKQTHSAVAVDGLGVQLAT